MLRPCASPGFSLLEVLIVLSIVGLLLGLGLPRYRNYAADQQLRSAVRALASDLRVAQQEAITRRAPVTVSFSGADPSCGKLPAASYALAHGSLVIKRACLASGIEWASPPASPTAFDPTGSVSPGMTVRLRSQRSARPYTLTVLAESGTIAHDAR